MSGATVDGYRIVRTIAEGGNGSVFAAEEIGSGRAVALKVLRDDRDDARTRFARESAVVDALHHPGIVPVLATGALADGRPYLVLPLLEGRSLREELEARGTLPEREAWEIARQIADALGAAHERGVIHRDVKPENVFLERVGDSTRVRVLDFGIAKRIDDAAVTRLTGTGAPLGTPTYMAPEQWWAQPVDGRTDQYALGVVLFELLEGRPPFEAQSFAELLQKHLHEPPPARANEVVRRMLAKERADRFATMTELVREGDRFFSRPPAHTRASTQPRPWAPVLAVAVGGPSLLVGVGYAGAARHDVVAWIVGGGLIAQVASTILAVAAFVAVARAARSGAVLWLALAPAFLGLGMTHVGWALVSRATQQALPLDRLDLLHAGIFEMNMIRFLGFGLAAMALAALAVMHVRTSTAHDRADVLDRITIGAGGVIAALSWLLSSPSVLLVAAVVVAPALAATLPRASMGDRRRGSSVLDRSFAIVVAAGLAAAVAFARIEAREAAAWSTETTRIDRAREIIAAAHERTTTTALVGLALVAVVALEALRLRREAREQPGSFAAWPRRFGLLLGAVAIAVGADAWLHVGLAEARAAVRRVLAPQFALFAALDPPAAPDGFGVRPRRATALQISRTMIAVDGVPVAPIAALVSAEGQAHVGAEIDRALAKTAVDGENAALVSLLIDREVRFGIVRRLLVRARASGAVTAEVLLVRGKPGHVPDDAPREAALVKATDFVALPVVLGSDGAEPRDEEPFGEVVPALVLSAGHLRSGVLSGGQ